MKTLAEKLDDLKAKLSKAKTDEERKTILDGIDEVIADAKTVAEALTKANDEAKKSRENSGTLQKEIDTLNIKIKDLDKGKDLETLKTELIEKLKELDKDKESKTLQADINKLMSQIKDTSKGDDKDKEVPAWAKDLVEKVKSLIEKDTSEAKTLLINEALKEKDLPESLAKFIVTEGNDPAKIKEAVEKFQQTLNDEKLLNLTNPKKGEQADVADELITDYAKGKNEPGKGSSISGKEIKME